MEERGHEVALITSDSGRRYVEAQGLTTFPAPSRFSFQTANWGMPDAVGIQLKHIGAAINSFRPAVLVGQQLTIGAILSGQMRSIPTVLIGMGTYLWTRPKSDDKFRAWLQREQVKHVTKVCQEFQLTQCDPNRIWGDRFLVRSFPAFEQPEDLPAEVALIGPCLWEPDVVDFELKQMVEEAIVRGQRVIYVQHGRSFHHPSFWPAFTEAARRSEHLFLASVERMDHALSSIPRNVIVRERVPQQFALTHASAMISSATTTPVLGSILHGVPSVLVPGGGEQPILAERCRELGIAVVLDRSQLNADQLEQRITTVVDDASYWESANKLQASAENWQSFAQACDVLTQTATAMN